MSTPHADDAVFLDALPWATPSLRRYCARCDRQAPTVTVGHIEGGSGPGYDIRHCRGCVALHLADGRRTADAAGLEFVPRLPRRGDG